MKNHIGQKVLRYTELAFKEGRDGVSREEKQEMSNIESELGMNKQQILEAAEKKLFDENVGDGH